MKEWSFVLYRIMYILGRNGAARGLVNIERVASQPIAPKSYGAGAEGLERFLPTRVREAGLRDGCWRSVYREGKED
jgi:hypothetical protein